MDYISWLELSDFSNNLFPIPLTVLPVTDWQTLYSPESPLFPIHLMRLFLNVFESQLFVYRDYATWHMPCCKPNVPMGRNKFLNLNSVTVKAKTESRGYYIALHLVVSSSLRCLQARVLGSNPWTGVGENLAGESEWIILFPLSLTAVILALSKALNPPISLLQLQSEQQFEFAHSVCKHHLSFMSKNKSVRVCSRFFFFKFYTSDTKL